MPGSYGPRDQAVLEGPVHERQTQRDIYPMPPMPNSEIPAGRFSRKCRRRIGQRKHFEEEVNHTIDSLNILFGAAGKHLQHSWGAEYMVPNAAQSQVLEFVKSACRRVGKPPATSGSEALEELRVAEGYEDLPTSSPLGSFNPDLVSLPTAEMNPIPLSHLWGPGGRQEVEDFSHTQTLSTTEAEQRLLDSGVEKCYEDPQFRDPHKYAEFIKRLFTLKLVDMSLQPAVERVGIFFVKKKGGKLRMILDCRRSNCHFADPKPIKLATGEAMARIELEPDQQLYTASADLQNAFYTMEMPAALRPYFGLRKLRAGDLGITEVQGQAVKAEQWLHPRVAVIPMGWSHAMWWCQRVSERICTRAGLTEAERLKDGERAPSGNFFHIQYVDNLHVFGTDKQQVEQRFWKAVQALRQVGLTVHEIEFDESDMSALGWSIASSAVLSPTLKRLWRLRLGIRELLKRGSATGQQLERIVGHITFVSLCRRESLAALGEVYTFIRRHYRQRVRLWKSVRRELWLWDGIAPLIFVDMAKPWDNTLYSVDASNWGMGVVTSSCSKEEAQALGRHCERWRFKDEQASNPRFFVRAEDELLLQGRYIDQTGGADRTFKTADFSAVNRRWTVVGRHRWLRPDSMPVYEARATLFAIRHALRSVASFGKKYIVLTDSMTAAVAFDKGRAHSFKLRRVLQQTAALCLGSGTFFRCRWIPSEWNAADGPSRGKFVPSEPVREFTDDPPAAGDPSHLGTRKEEEVNTGEKKPPATSTWWGQTSRWKGRSRKAVDMGHRTEWSQCLSETNQEGAKAPSSTCPTATQYPQESFSEQCDPEPVRCPLSGVCSVDTESCFDPDTVAYIRPPFDGLSGASIPAGGGSQSGQLHHGCNHLSGARVERFGIPANGTAVHERMEEVMPAKISDAHPVRGHLFVGTPGMQEGPRRGCPGNDVDLFTLPEAKRGLFVEEPRHCQTSEEQAQGLQALCSGVAPAGGRGPFKDPAVGRDVEPGLGLPEILGPSIGAAPTARQEGPRRTGLFNQCGGCEQLHARPLGKSRVDALGTAPPVSAATWGRFARGGSQSARVDGHSGPRQMADPQVSQKLREGRQTTTAVRGTKRRHQKGKPLSSTTATKAVALPALSAIVRLVPCVFLEVFSGCGRLGRSVARHCGWPVLLWDIDYGDQYDLTVRTNQMRIVHWITSGVVRGGHLGTPCNSFSRARDRPGGPPRLRTDDKPLGLDGLRDVDAGKVRVGNTLMYFSCRILRLAMFWRIPFTLENPERSRLWLCPAVKSLLRRRGTSSVVVHFCAFGTSWKKPTRFFGVNVELDILQQYICKSSKRGLCAYSGKPHVALMGQTATGVWLTKVAEPYPLRLTHKLAQVFQNTELSWLANDFGKHLM